MLQSKDLYLLTLPATIATYTWTGGATTLYVYADNSINFSRIKVEPAATTTCSTTSVTSGTTYTANSFDSATGTISVQAIGNEVSYLSSNYSEAILASNPIAATISLTSAAATVTQSVYTNTAITNITYDYTGSAVITWSGTSGSTVPPTGVSVSNSNGSITINGVPSVAGTYGYSIAVSAIAGGSPASASASGSITVTDEPVDATITLTSTSGTDAQSVITSQSIDDITYSYTGTYTSITWTGSSTTTPSGITVDSGTSGSISIIGTPATAGTYNYKIDIAGIGTGANTSTTGSFTVSDPTTLGDVTATYTMNGSDADVTWGAVANASSYNVKVCSGGVSATSTTYDFNSEAATTYNNGDVLINGLTVVNSTKTVSVASASGTYGGITITKMLKFSGGGSTTDCAVKLTTDGAGTLTVYCNAADNGRVLAVNDGSSLISDGSSSNTVVVNLPSAGTYYIYSASSGMNIYLIDFSSSSSCTEYSVSGTSYTATSFNSATSTISVQAVGNGVGYLNGIYTEATELTSPVDASITLGSGSATQSVYTNVAITDIDYTFTGTYNNITWSTSTPAGITVTPSGGTVNISGTPTTAGIYDYTITIDGLNGGTATTATGTITVTDAPTYSITFTVTDGTNPIDGATVTIDGLSGTTNASGQVTISGVSAGAQSYSITKTGYTSTSGTIAVSENTSESATMTAGLPKVAYITNSASATYGNDTKILPALQAEFDVTLIQSTTTGVDFSGYDLVILSEVPGSADAINVELEGIDKPFLMMKVHAYKSTVWNWAASGFNQDATLTNMVVSNTTHEIFSGINFTGTSNNEIQILSSVNNSKGLTYADPSQFTVSGGTISKIATLGGNTAQVGIFEIPVGTTVGGNTTTKRWMQIGINSESYANVTSDGQKLITNTAYYLMGMSIPASTTKTISSFSINGVSGTISGTNITVNLPAGTDLSALTPTIAHNGASISPTGSQDFSSSSVTYTVTAGDGSTQTYTVTVTKTVPVIAVCTSSVLSFSTETNVASDSILCQITGTDLAEDITVTVASPFEIRLSDSDTWGTTKTITATVGDADKTIQIRYNPTAAGPHSATILVSSLEANTQTIALEGITTDVNTPPTVVMSAPANGSCVTEGASLTLSAIATDIDGTVSSVEFYNGSTLIGSGTQDVDTFSYTWTVPANLSDTIYAIAIDDATDSTFSDTIIINLNPTIIITDPSAVCAPSTVDLTAADVTTGSTASLTYSYFTDATATTAIADEKIVDATGTYYIVGTTNEGCHDTASVVVTVNAKPLLTVNATPTAVCAPSTIDLTSGTNSDIAGTITYYSDAALSSVITNQTAVDATGTYYVLVNSTSGSCRDTASIDVTINEKPVLTVNATPAAVCAPSTIDLTNGTSTTAGTIAYYTDAALTSTESTPASIASTGTYYVLAQTTNGCRDTASIDVTVNEKPVLTVNATPAAVCAPSTIDLTNGTSTTVGTIAYYTDAALTSTESTPAAIASTGTYYVLAQTTNGCRDTASIDVTVNEKPVLTVNATPAAVCAPSTIDLTNGTSTTVGTIAYYTDAALTSTESTPASIASTGTYYVLAQTTNGCRDTASIDVTVNEKPVLTVNATPAAVCAPSTIDLTNGTSTTVGTIAYYTDAALTSTESTPASIASTGTYYVLAQTTNGCRDTASIDVTVNAKPVLTVNATPAAVCAPSTIDLTNGTSTTVGTIAYYTDAALTSTESTPAAIASTGTYYVLAQTTNGCRDTASIDVTVNEKPVLTVNATPAAVCAPSTIDLTSGTSSDIAGTITYYSDAALSSVITNQTAVDATGTYYVLVNSTSGSCRDTASIDVTINKKPVLTVNATPAAVCAPSTIDLTSGTSSDLAGTITYYTDAVLSSAVADPTAVDATGTYYVLINSTSGSCRDTASIDVTVNSQPTITVSSAASCATDLLTYGLDVTVSSGSVTATEGNATDNTGNIWTIDNITAGNNITITVTGANTCTNTIDITAPNCSCAPMDAPVSAGDTAYCQGNAIPTISASVNTGETIDWYNVATGGSPIQTASLTYTPTVAGTYYAEARNTTTACTSTTRTAIKVTENTKPVLTVNATPAAVCAPSTIDLTNGTSTTAGTIAYYTDAALTSTESTPASIASTGTYYVLAQTTNGCRDTASIDVTVNEKPVLTVNATPAAVCAPSTIDLTNGTSTTVGTIAYYTDAALTSTESTPASIASTGTYYVLAQTTNGCRDTASIDVTVNEKPVLTVNATPAAVCAPSTIDLTNGTSTTVGTIAYYTDAALTSTESTPAAIASTGTYYVLAQTTNGCRDTASIDVTVNEKPVLTVNATPAAVCAPSTIDLTSGTSSDIAGTITYYSDAALSSVITNQTAVDATGTYYVLVNSTSGSCRDTASIDVTVNSQPTITVSSAASCATDLLTYGLDVTVSSGSVTATEGNATDNTGNIWTIDNITAGNNITITVTGANTCTNTIDITAPNCSCAPMDAPVSAGDTAYCQGNAIPTISASVNTGETIDWYNVATGGSPIQTASLTYTPTVAGTYYAEARNTTTACTSTTRTAIKVTENTKPVLTVNATPTAVCAPSTIDLTNGTSTTVGTIAYYTDAALTSTESTPASIASTGTYYVLAQTTNGCRDTASIDVTVNAKPVLTVNATPAAVCAPSTIDLTNGTSTTVGTIAYYTDAALTSTESTPAAIASTGTYYVLAQTTNGCRDTASIDVTVNEKPVLTVNATPAAVCAPSTIDLTSGTSSDIAGTITYYSDAALSSVITNQTAVDATGTYYVLVNSTSGSCRDTASIDVTINKKPVLTVNATPAAVCAPSTIDLTSGTSSDLAGTITYYTDAVLSSAVADPTAVDATGTYYVLINSTSGSCRDTASIDVTVNSQPTITVSSAASCATDLLTYGLDVTVSSGSVTATEGNATDNTGNIWTIDNITAGNNITITVTGANTCTNTIDITAPNCSCAPMDAPVSAGDTAYCQGNATPTISASVNTGETIDWYNVATGGSPIQTASLTYTPTVAGTYYAEARNTTTACTSTTRTAIKVTENTKPVLTVNATPAAVCAPSTIDLTNGTSTTAGTIAYYTDAALTSTESTPASIASTGTYYVLAQTTNGCRDTASIDVTVNAKPTITVSNTPACAADLATYALEVTVSAGTVTADYGTPSDLGSNIWSISSVLTGNDVTIIVTDNTCTDTLEVTAPSCSCGTIDAPISLGDTTYCQGSTIPTISVTVNSDETVDWYDAAVGGNKLLSDNSSYTPTAAGTYYAEARIITSGCLSSTRTAVIVTENSLPTLTITDPASICPGATADITDASITDGSDASLTYTYWTGLAKSTEINDPTTVSAGKYYIEGTNTLGCSTTASVTVSEIDIPELTISSPDTAITCLVSNLTMSATLGFTDYTWVKNGTNTAVNTRQYPISSTDSDYEGIYTVKALYSGCNIQSNDTVTIVKDDIVPTVSLTVSGAYQDSIITCNDVVLGYELSTTSVVENVKWKYFSTTVSNADTVIAEKTGTYNLSVTLANGCTTNKVSTTLYKQAPPVVAINGIGNGKLDENQQSLTLSSSQSAVNYTWSRNGNVIGNDSALVVSDAGQYDLSVTYESGCVMTATSVTVEEYDWIATPTNFNQSLTIGQSISDIAFTVGGETSTVTVTGLPDGVTYNSATNTISGTPTAVGSYTYTITTDGTNPTTVSGTITVNKVVYPVPTINVSANLTQKVKVRTEISNIYFTWTGGDYEDIIVEGLPDGVTYTIDETAGTLIISGTPTLSSAYTITTIDMNGDSVQYTGEIKVAGHIAYQKGNDLVVTGDVNKLEVYNFNGKYIRKEEGTNIIYSFNGVTGNYVVKITEPNKDVYAVKFNWKATR